MKKFSVILYNKPFLLFILFVLTAYLPVLLPYFHLKNDILTQNLPTRFVFGESLYSGYEPFWNPYINFGIPQYGDMNNGFWNPLQWLIGNTTGYNIYTITIEEIFYILLGGWGIYLTTKEMFSKNIALITGLTYMCCGYITGHMQYLCWITGTAFFPYVLLFFIRVHKGPSIRNFLAGGTGVFLFTASTHPGLIIGAAYFFIFALSIIYFNRKSFLRNFYHDRFWQTNGLFFLISCLLSIVVIWSNVDVLQHISRGSKVSITETLMAPTSFQSYLSLYLPLPVHKTNFFDTDIAMRNSYIGIAHFAGILILARVLNRRVILSLIIPLLFFILLAAGGWFKIIAWKFLPLLGFVRLNGEFTYFVILILLLGGAIGLQHWADKQKKNDKLGTYILAGTILIGCLGGIASFITRESILFTGNINGSSLKEIIKLLLDNTSFWDLLLIQAFIQILSLYLIRIALYNKLKIITVLCFNLVLNTWLTLPFTGLGLMSKSEIQSVLTSFPRGIQPQPLVSIKNAEYINPADESQFLLISSYSRKIGHIRPDQYPVQLKSNSEFTADSALSDFIRDQAFIFLSTDTTINTVTNFDTSRIQIEVAGPGYTKCTIKNDQYNWLVLLQNNYHYWQVLVNGKRAVHFTVYKTFIAIPVEKGEHTIEFKFSPVSIKIIMWVNIIFLIFALGMCLIPKLASLKVFK